MGALWLVRHGQTAGFPRGPYVDLTALGEAQGRAVGAWLARRTWVPRRSAVGPLPRHAQTWRQIAAGGSFGDAEVVPGLDEHAGVEVFGRAVRGQVPGVPAGLPETRGEALALFRGVLLAWAAGELEVDGVAPWSSFMARAGQAIDGLLADVGQGRHVVAVTSAGVIGVAVARAVRGDAVLAARLSLEVRNAAITHLRVGEGSVDLASFNEVGHLGDGLVTAI